MLGEITPGRVKAARILAVAADFVQIGLLPLFVEGWLSPVNDALDAVVAIALVVLVGWHWAFVPAFLAEMVPVFGLVPTWTAAVLIATRGASPEGVPAGSSSGERLPPAPPAPPALPPDRGGSIG